MALAQYNPPRTTDDREIEQWRVEITKAINDLYNLKTGANQAAAGAIADELWADTDDDYTIKLGV